MYTVLLKSKKQTKKSQLKLIKIFIKVFKIFKMNLYFHLTVDIQILNINVL